MNNRPYFFRQHCKVVCSLFLLIIFLTACLNNESVDVVVTEVVVVEGREQIVTRIVQQIVTTTPSLPFGEDESDAVEPVELDISFLVNTPPNIDPQLTDTQAGIDLVQNLFVGLTRYNHATNEIEPELALGWDVTDNGRLWTFHLRDDIYWVKPTELDEDGLWAVEQLRPVIASDIVYGIQRVCSRENNAPDAVILFMIEGCEQVHGLVNPTPADFNRIGATAVNNNTLQISLNKPAAHFLTISGMSLLRPVPQQLLEDEEIGEDWLEPENLITSGPFFPIPDSRSLQRNPAWPIVRSQGNVDIVNIIYLTDSINVAQLWEANQLDLATLQPLADAAMEERLIERSILLPGQTVFYLAFNFDSGVFREPTLRRAFSAAINREELIEQIYDGKAVGARHLTPPGIRGALPVDEIGMGYDPDYARIQLRESGFGSCRLIPPIRLLVTSADQSLRQAELIRQMWVDELGCSEEQIIIDQAQFGTLLANTRRDAGAARPDIWELGWASYYPDAQNWVGDLLHCADSDNRQNRPCTEVDDLIRQAASELDSEERNALYRDIEMRLFSREGLLPLIPLHVPGTYLLVKSWLDHSPALFGGEQYDSYFIDVDLKRLQQSR